MTPKALLDLFRAEVRDTSSPPLWSDVEIFSYMDDAQKMFCRLQGGIADSTSAITQVAFTAGTKFVAISPAILKLRHVELQSSGRILEILNYEDMETRMPVDDYRHSNPYIFDNLPGDVRAVIVGMEANSIRLMRIPEVADTLNLIVYRMPIADITPDSTVFEIDPLHHRHLLPWMKHLAHMKQDAETYDRGRSAEFKQEFLSYCDQAKHERERREHKYRTVVYGGV